MICFSLSFCEKIFCQLKILTKFNIYFFYNITHNLYFNDLLKPVVAIFSPRHHFGHYTLI